MDDIHIWFRVLTAILWALAAIFWVVFRIVKRRQLRRELIERAQRDFEKGAAYLAREYGPLGRTTDEILSHDDKEINVLGALCHRIGEKEAMRGESSLTEAEKRLCAVYELEGQVGNGGFDQYFFNSSGGNAEMALVGLKDMGAADAAAILERAMAVFPGGKPPTDRKSRWKAMDRIASRSAPAWQTCDSEFYQKGQDTYELCLAYARTKRTEIVLP
jgi:hypothetical protein